MRGARAGARRGNGHALWVEHLRALRESVDQAWGSAAATLIGVAVMAVAIALPAIVYVLVQNQRSLAAEWSGEPSLTVFLRQEASTREIDELRARLASDGTLSGVEYVSPEQAYAEFATSAGLSGSALRDSNPLPPVLIVALTQSAWAENRGAAVVERLTAERAVESVIVDFDWVERFAALGALVERGVMVLAVVLAGGVLLIVGNTVRVLIHEQAHEIEILKLVGATDAFVRRPFLYSGALHGLVAGFLAVALVEAVFAALASPVARLATAYMGTFTLSGLSWVDMVRLLAISIALGWCGAHLGIALSLRRLGSRAA